MKKYKLTEESMLHKGYTLWCIENIVTGEKGGWIENEKNLSQSGDCMILENAKVYEKAVIKNNAQVYGTARVKQEIIVATDEYLVEYQYT